MKCVQLEQIELNVLNSVKNIYILALINKDKLGDKNETAVKGVGQPSILGNSAQLVRPYRAEFPRIDGLTK